MGSYSLVLQESTPEHASYLGKKESERKREGEREGPMEGERERKKTREREREIERYRERKKRARGLLYIRILSLRREFASGRVGLPVSTGNPESAGVSSSVL